MPVPSCVESVHRLESKQDRAREFTRRPQQGFTARYPQLGHARGREQPRQANDLTEAQALLGCHELEVAVIFLFRHAIGAAEVAAIGNGDAKVPQGTIHPIDGTII